MSNTTARDELRIRTAWALQRVTELVKLGRGAGWIPGRAEASDGSEIVERTMRAMDARDTPMGILRQQLQLATEEVDALWLLACAEIDPQVSGAAYPLFSPGTGELNAQILERLVARGGIPESDILERLVAMALVEIQVDHRTPMFRRSVRACDQVVDLARGRFGLDRSLAKRAKVLTAADARRALAKFQIDVPPAVTAAMSSTHSGLVVLTGPTGSGRATVLQHAVALLDRSSLVIRSRTLAEDHAALSREMRGIVRECILHGATPILLGIDMLGERLGLVAEELASLPFPAFATSSAPSFSDGPPHVSIVKMERPTAASRARIWRSLLPSVAADVIETCAQRYNLMPGQMATAAAHLTSCAGVTQDAIHEAIRPVIEGPIGDLARRIETTQTWDDLVLPVDQHNQLVELVARVQHRTRVLEQWGFADKVGRGTGVAALLSGPPGTGKTMIAGLLARELGLDLYQVDLSKIVSKYVGETEKQLSSLFDAAESGHAILLFDEADALFGKRTEVKSSNDRFANIEVNYLLQRIEAFAGITLLTTNHETAIDSAFLRRLAFHIRVPMPDEEERTQLWHAILPAAAERDSDLQFARLAAEFAMSGGYIKNAVLRAAFMSASEGTRITNEALFRAARNEYEAMGKVAYRPSR